MKRRIENTNAGHIWLQAVTCLQNSLGSDVTTAGFLLRRRKLLIQDSPEERGQFSRACKACELPRHHVFHPSAEPTGLRLGGLAKLNDKCTLRGHGRSFWR
jgi:hypothetical protein